MSVADRIKQASSNLTRGWQASLARHCGVSAATVSDWVSGNIKEVSAENLFKIADFLGVRPRWLIFGAGPQKQTENFGVSLGEEGRFPTIKNAKVKAVGGTNGFAIETIDDDEPTLAFSEQWFINNGFNHKKLYAIKVLGSSMEPSIYEGDTVVVNTEQTEPKDGVVYLVLYEGVPVVKRLIRESGFWWLRSDNPNQNIYPMKKCDDASTVIVGAIVFRQTQFI